MLIYRTFISWYLFIMCYIVCLSDINLVTVVDYKLHYIVFTYRTFISWYSLIMCYIVCL